MTDNVFTLVTRQPDDDTRKEVEEILSSVAEDIDDIESIIILTVDKEGNPSASTYFESRQALVFALEAYKFHVMLDG